MKYSLLLTIINRFDFLTNLSKPYNFSHIFIKFHLYCWFRRLIKVYWSAKMINAVRHKISVAKFHMKKSNAVGMARGSFRLIKNIFFVICNLKFFHE